MEKTRDRAKDKSEPGQSKLLFSFNTSVAGVGETQALDSVGTSMESKGVGGGVMRDGPFQTCSQLLGPIPTLTTGPDPLLV